MTIRGGWFKVHRGWMASPDFQPEPFTEREAFLWSIEQAAYEPHVQWFNGREVAVERGEFATSIRKMAGAFQWSEKRVRLFIARMEKRGKWAQRGAHEGAHLATVITVCNYGLYQSREDEEGTAGGALGGTARAQQGHSKGTQQKKGKKLREGEEGKKSEAAPQLALVRSVPFDDALEAWTQAASVAGWKPLNPALSDKRRKGLGKVLTAHGLGGFVDALQRGLDSEMLNPGNGHDPPGWFNFEFVCNPNNFLKLSEGNYDKQFSTGTSNQQSGSSAWLDARASALAG